MIFKFHIQIFISDSTVHVCKLDWFSYVLEIGHHKQTQVIIIIFFVKSTHMQTLNLIHWFVEQAHKQDVVMFVWWATLS